MNLRNIKSIKENGLKPVPLEELFSVTLYNGYILNELLKATEDLNKAIAIRAAEKSPINPLEYIERVTNNFKKLKDSFPEIDKPSLIKAAYSSNPEEFMKNKQKQIENLIRDERFAIIKDSRKFFTLACFSQKNPEQFLLSKIELLNTIIKDEEFAFILNNDKGMSYIKLAVFNRQDPYNFLRGLKKESLKELGHDNILEENDIKNFSSFYEIAEKRPKSFVENLMEQHNKNKEARYQLKAKFTHRTTGKEQNQR